MDVLTNYLQVYSASVSTTSAPLFGLASNIGPDFGPDLALFGSLQFSGSVGPVVTVTGTPFSYDPQNGNLLLWVFLDGTPSGAGNVLFQSDYTGLVTGTGGGTPNDLGGLVTGFNESGSPVPEPASIVQLALGLAGIGALILRR